MRPRPDTSKPLPGPILVSQPAPRSKSPAPCGERDRWRRRGVAALLRRGLDVGLEGLVELGGVGRGQVDPIAHPADGEFDGLTPTLGDVRTGNIVDELMNDTLGHAGECLSKSSCEANTTRSDTGKTQADLGAREPQLKGRMTISDWSTRPNSSVRHRHPKIQISRRYLTSIQGDAACRRRDPGGG